MAKEPKGPKGSITQPADSKNERISEISNVNRTISNMQKQVESQLVDTEKDLRDSDAIQSVQHSLTKVLNKLSSTVGDIGKGFSKIAVTTTQTGKEAIKDYGRAISQEFAINKQNFVAMTLARSTPIYGYFISKFMETNVWKNATEKLKSNIASSLSSVGGLLKNIIRRPFIKSTSDETPSQKAGKKYDKIPKMQRGGYVERAGLAKVHAAEVVMPIEKVLSRIDESISITKELARYTTLHQLQSLTRFNQYVQDTQQYQKVGLVKGFFQALKTVNTRYEQPASTRILRAVLAIQDTMGATIGKWPQVWQKLLIEHPMLRQTVFFMRGLHQVMRVPGRILYSLFRGRGPYKQHLSKSRNPMLATAENVGALYTESIYKLDHVIQYTKATAEATRDLSSAITGKVYPSLPGISKKQWSIAGVVFQQATKLITAPFEVAHWAGSKIGSMFGGKKKDDEDKVGERTVNLLEDLKNQNNTNFNMSRETLDKIKEAAETTEKHSETTATNLIAHDKREKRRTILGFLGGMMSPVKGLFSGLLGKLGFMGILLAGAGNFLRELFLGKGAKGSIVGGLFRRLGKMKLKFPAGFMGKLFPTLLKLKGLSWLLGGKLGLAILGGITAWKTGQWAFDKIEAWLSTTPWIQKHREASKERAETYGYTPEDTGFDVMHKTMEKNLKDRDQTVQGVYGLRSSMDQTVATSVKESATTPQQALHGYTVDHINAVSQAMVKQQLRERDIGAHGKRNLDVIFWAQHKFMSRNAGEYWNYDPDHINEMRSKWLSDGGYRGIGFFTNPEKYGEKREAHFLKYLKKHGTPLSEKEKKNRLREIRVERNELTGMDHAAMAGKKLGEIAESGYQALGEVVEPLQKKMDKSKYIKTLEKNAKLYENTRQTNQTVFEAALQKQIDKKRVEAAGNLYETRIREKESMTPRARFDTMLQEAEEHIRQRELLKEQLNEQKKTNATLKGNSDSVVNAIQNQTTVISNNVNNTTNNAGGGIMGWLSGMRDKFTDYTIRGEIDGD